MTKKSAATLRVLLARNLEIVSSQRGPGLALKTGVLFQEPDFMSRKGK